MHADALKRHDPPARGTFHCVFLASPQNQWFPFEPLPDKTLDLAHHI
jgi:hypothetical protein